MTGVDPASPVKTISVKTAFSCRWLTVRKALVDDGTERSSWFYLDHPACSLILPITADGNVVLIRVWRVAVRRWCLEAPAGRCEPAEHPATAARRELLEEVGGTSATVVPLGQTLTSSGCSNERVHLFAGLDTKLGESNRDPHEHIELDLVPRRQAVSYARDSVIDDAATALAVLQAAARGLLGGPS
jgi:ADP-ribose diphosphatase